MIPAILLMGPTASGKSALALDLAGRLSGEIVAVDSAQVYRGMDVGTAKPTAADRTRVPHHLLDIIDPTMAYSAAAFVRDALAAVTDIRARGRTPLLCGGTMLYFRALTEGLSALPRADAAVRAELDRRAANEGWPALHAELAKVDPLTAARLAPTDGQRIQRALEVHRLSGQPISSLQGRRDSPAALGPSIALALVPADRARLHADIARRFEAMLDAGLVDELRALAATLRARSGAALDALRRVSPGMAIPGWCHRSGAAARHGNRRNAPACEAAAHVAAHDAGDGLRQCAAGSCRHRGGFRPRSAPPE